MNKVRLMQEAVRAILFRNEANAGQWFAPCSEEDLLAAEKACIHYDRPVRLRDLAHALPEPIPEENLPSLETTFCGLRCENPFFLASSAICTNYEMVAAEADRDTVVYPVIDRDLCVGCHLCRLICRTGAIGISKRVPKRKKA